MGRAVTGSRVSTLRAVSATGQSSTSGTFRKMKRRGGSGTDKLQALESWIIEMRGGGEVRDVGRGRDIYTI